MKRFLAPLCIALTLIMVFPYHVFGASTDSCYDTDTVAMSHFDNDGSQTVVDVATCAGCPLSWSGLAYQVSTQKKFGSDALRLHGGGFTDDYQTIADDSSLDLPGDFTIDFWILFDNVSTSANSIFQLGTSSSPNNGMILTHDSDRTNEEFSLTINGSSHGFPVTLSNDTFYHIALVRSSNTIKLYVNGTAADAGWSNSTSIASDANGFTIGDGSEGAVYSTYIYIDEFRIVKGTAVWTSNFTSPSAAYSECAAPASSYDGSLTSPMSNGGFFF